MAINTMRELRGYYDFKHAPHPLDGSLTEEEARLLKHGYYASVSYVDTQVGRLLDRLDELDLTANTIVVLWGDHGWKLGEHNSWAKMTNLEVDTRAPLLIRAPGKHPAGLKLSQLVEFVDIYPTLCELAGLPVPGSLEGISAVPLFENPRLPWKEAVFSQFLRSGIWTAPDGVEYMGYAVRTGRFRYVTWMDWESGDTVAHELYDHEVDPLETINLAGHAEYSSILADLESRRRGGWQSALPDMTP